MFARVQFWFSSILALADLAFLFQSQLRQGSIEQHVMSAVLMGPQYMLRLFSLNISKGSLSVILGLLDSLGVLENQILVTKNQLVATVPRPFTSFTSTVNDCLFEQTHQKGQTSEGNL